MTGDQATTYEHHDELVVARGSDGATVHCFRCARSDDVGGGEPDAIERAMRSHRCGEVLS